jgi:hypothetical protein
MSDELGAPCLSLRSSSPCFQSGGALLSISDVKTLRIGILRLTANRFLRFDTIPCVLVTLAAEDA